MEISVFESLAVNLWAERRQNAIDDLYVLGWLSGTFNAFAETLAQNGKSTEANDAKFLSDILDTLAKDVIDYLKSLALLGDVVIETEAKYA